MNFTHCSRSLTNNGHDFVHVSHGSWNTAFSLNHCDGESDDILIICRIFLLSLLSSLSCSVIHHFDSDGCDFYRVFWTIFFFEVFLTLTERWAMRGFLLSLVHIFLYPLYLFLRPPIKFHIHSFIQIHSISQLNSLMVLALACTFILGRFSAYCRLTWYLRGFFWPTWP